MAYLAAVSMVHGVGTPCRNVRIFSPRVAYYSGRLRKCKENNPPIAKIHEESPNTHEFPLATIVAAGNRGEYGAATTGSLVGGSMLTPRSGNRELMMKFRRTLRVALLVASAHAAVARAQSTNLPTMEVAQAVMVTVDLDFGNPPPSLAEALREIERQYQPEDGHGRTFAILEAYGTPTSDGKLHISMHVSTEKPGGAALVFRRTGKILWKIGIVPATHPPASSFAGKNLLIMLDDEKCRPYLLDGSKAGGSIMDARVRDLDIPVRDFWPDGSEREVTFFYSACGCPVKVMARRVGDKSVRTQELPVIFPDDPAVAATIARLMGWN